MIIIPIQLDQFSDFFLLIYSGFLFLILTWGLSLQEGGPELWSLAWCTCWGRPAGLLGSSKSELNVCSAWLTTSSRPSATHYNPSRLRKKIVVLLILILALMFFSRGEVENLVVVKCNAELLRTMRTWKVDGLVMITTSSTIKCMKYTSYMELGNIDLMGKREGQWTRSSKMIAPVIKQSS